MSEKGRFSERREASSHGCSHTPDLRSASLSQQDLGSIHMMLQLLDLSLLNVEESRSVLLGRCRSLLERRRSGLLLLAGWILFVHATAAVRKTLWMLFSDVKAEHSRYASAPSCLAREEP